MLCRCNVNSSQGNGTTCAVAAPLLAAPLVLAAASSASGFFSPANCCAFSLPCCAVCLVLSTACRHKTFLWLPLLCYCALLSVQVDYISIAYTRSHRIFQEKAALAGAVPRRPYRLQWHTVGRMCCKPPAYWVEEGRSNPESQSSQSIYKATTRP